MKHKHTAFLVISLLLVFLLACSAVYGMHSVSVRARANDTAAAEIPEEETTAPETVLSEERERVTLEFPYYIKVDKGAQIVTVYTTNEEGKYEKIVREMACSTGIKDYKLPDGFYRLKEKRIKWGTLLSTYSTNDFGQYLTQINGHIYFHSIPYRACASASLKAKEYNKLGSRASGGCVRLTVENSKWIFDNAAPGTTVEVCTGPERPDDLAKLIPPKLELNTKWDPSDPDPNNPDYQTMYPDAENEPQPDPYAELFPYKFEYISDIYALHESHQR